MGRVAMEDTSVKLCNTNLDRLPTNVLRPTYDRSVLTPGIVHIGLGNFHRAHQAWYLHRLMQSGQALNWAIVGAGVRPNDVAMRDRLSEQDYLTTLIGLDPDSTSVEITGSMIDFLPVEENNASLITCMADPAIRIVALTVTEGGYYRNADGALNLDHQDIRHDATNPATPKTAFGAMVAAYKARRDAGLDPFTGMCCDNLQHNGDVLRRTVVGLARLSDPDLADWIEANASFPNSMVDCIVPATGPTEIAEVQSYGIDDAAPVTHEGFRQWVIEDNFCAGRPPWEEVGATLTDDVIPYETMKIRMLNAGHQVIANVGELLSVPTIAACMADEDIRTFLVEVEKREIAPYVDDVPGMNPLQYLELITGRFANPKIHDTTRRVAFDGSSRHPGFVLPILRDALAANGPIDGLALTEAFWARMCFGVRDDGSEIENNDPEWSALSIAAKAAKVEPNAWLAQKSIYGNLGEDARFAERFDYWLKYIWEHGSRNALKHLAE